MILDLIVELGAWSWVIGGIILLALELMAPGNVFVWFGIAALVTGGFAFLTSFGWQVQGLVFVVLAVIFAYAGRRYFGRRAGVSEQPFLNQRANGLVGRSYVLSEPIVNGHGQVRIDDTRWRIVGPDLPSGTRITITAADGAVLSVSKAE